MSNPDYPLTWPDGMDRSPHVPLNRTAVTEWAVGMTVVVPYRHGLNQRCTSGKLLRKINPCGSGDYWMVKYIAHPGGTYVTERELRDHYSMVGYYADSSRPDHLFQYITPFSGAKGSSWRPFFNFNVFPSFIPEYPIIRCCEHIPHPCCCFMTLAGGPHQRNG